MPCRHKIPVAAAAFAALLSASALAQTPAEEAAAATAEMYEKMDAATAADDKFHANRTHADMVARDKADAEAAAAIERAHAAEDRARAAKAGSH